MEHPLFQKLAADRLTWRTEEEVRQGWLKHLGGEGGFNGQTKADGPEGSDQQVMIEFRDPGQFKGSSESVAFKQAIYDYLATNIIRRAESQRLPPEQYMGIVTDGDHLGFAFIRGGGIVHRHLLPFNEATVALVTQACRDGRRRVVTFDHLVEDFGLNSTVGTAMIGALESELAAHLKRKSNSKIRRVFDDWRTLFGQVTDLGGGRNGDLRHSMPIGAVFEPTETVAALLFVIHTYNAFVIKMLAAEIVSECGLTSCPDFCEHLLGLGDHDLLTRLRDAIEGSAFFEAARIRGFVEEAVFSWYTEPSLSGPGQLMIAEAIRSLVIQLSLYRMDDLDALRSRDILKSFYQALVPEPLRKALGEFYTPDWLVDVACDRTGVKDWLNVRVLDPTCGSGSFLLEVVRRKRVTARSAPLDAQATLRMVLDSVWGFDLNPLAVQSARVNFLISIADLLATTTSEITLPILLADAVCSPAPGPENGDEVIEYGVGRPDSGLTMRIPAALAGERRRLDGVFAVLAKCVEACDDYGGAERSLIDQGCLSSNEVKRWRPHLSETYRQVSTLHQQNRNGIWFRLAGNFFGLAAAGQFDLIVGNPPWVRWSSLPEHYRHRIKSTCDRYAIFSKTPFHGGNELDISGMITYTVGDKWLKVGGTLVFVITQSHFQSPSSQGFRNFKIDGKTGFLPVEIDDLKKLKPFPKVANKTAIMRLEKVVNTPPVYPVPYRVWQAAAGASTLIPEDADKACVLTRVLINHWEATPVAGGNAPWAILPKGRFRYLAALRGQSNWIAGRKGVTCDLNGVFLVRMVGVNKADGLVEIQTRPEAGRTDIGPAKTFWVEPDLLFPLLKGAGDFSACNVHVGEQLYIFVPNRGINRSDYEEARIAVRALKGTSAYFKAFGRLLAERSTYKLRQKGAPDYVVYNVGAYTFAPYKVVWAELSALFEASVIGNTVMPVVGERVYIPDHKIYFADFASEDVAHYVCSLLNSSPVREYIQSHTIQIQVSNIFKHLSLPPFDPTDGDHRTAVTLSIDAHRAKRDQNRRDVLGEMDVVAGRILGHR